MGRVQRALVPPATVSELAFFPQRMFADEMISLNVFLILCRILRSCFKLSI